MKKLLALILTLAMILSIPVIQGTAFAAQDVTLTISMWGDEARAEAYKKTLAPFCEANNCDVEISVIPLADYYGKLSANLAAGTGTDIFWTAANNEALYISNGYCANLRPTLEATPDYDMDDWYEGALERTDYVGDGGIYGTALSFGVRGIFYNKTMFENAGVKTPRECWEEGNWTYETMFDLASKIKAFDDTVVGCKLWCNGQSNMSYVSYADILLAYGARLVNEDSTEFTLDSPQGIKVINMINDAMKSGIHAQPGDETAFLSGQVAMAREPYSYMKNVVNADVDFEWDIVPLPYGDAGTDAKLYTGYAYWHANADSENVDLATKLIAFISNKENMEEWCLAFMAPRKSVMSSEKIVNLGEGYPSPETISAVFAKSVEERPLDAYTGTAQWSMFTTTVEQYFQNIWAGVYNVEDGIAAMKEASSPFLG